MAYTVNLTNGGIFAQVTDGQTVEKSNLTIIGKNFSGYGEFIAENFVHILENSADTSSPADPVTGQLWFDTSANILKVYNGTIFKNLGAVPQSSEPLSPVVADLWFDTANEQLKVYDGTAFSLVGPIAPASAGATGPSVTTVTDTLATDHIVVYHWVNDEIVGITNKDTEFTPEAPGITGFTTIRPGYNLSTTLTGANPRFVGTATNADLLDTLDSTQFLRSDVAATTSGAFGVLNDSGLTIGADSDAKFFVAGADVYLRNVNTDADVLIQVAPGGTPTSVISIDGTTARARVGTPIAGTDIANLDYVGTEITTLGSTKVSLDGTLAMSGNLNMGTSRVVSVSDPVDLQDVATKNYILNLVFGTVWTVGSYFFGPDPNGLIPGTWTQVPAGTFLMASASGNGATGGTNSLTLSIANMPLHDHGGGDHTHNISAWDENNAGSSNSAGVDNNNSKPDVVTKLSGNIITPEGGGVAFDNRPQYESVEVWKRIA